MKRTLIGLLAAALVAGVVPVSGQEPAPAQGKKNARANLAEMDTNKDGKIARSEWKGKDKRFARLDTDNDGFVTQDELKNARGKRKRR